MSATPAMTFLGPASMLLILATAAGQAPTGRSDRWENNVHTVGETHPRQDKVLGLLGHPDAVESLVVTGPKYARNQPLACAEVSPGTRLDVWRYAASPTFTYFVYFDGTRMVCLSGASSGTLSLARCHPAQGALAHALEGLLGNPPGANVAALHDLDGDGLPEAIVYLTGPESCGSGGCTLLVLTQAQGTWKLVSRIPAVRPPIRALTIVNEGWKSLSVTVAGGGIMEPYTAELPFGPQGYPHGASAPPAKPATEKSEGATLINPDECHG